MEKIREFFRTRQLLEVETPILSRYGVTDVYLTPMQTRCHQQTYYLHTSPEYAMKRLLAAGSGPIFQLARVFRDDEWGRWHNPEFTLLEWYQLDYDHHQLMTQMDEFLQHMLGCAPLRKISYREAFMRICDVDVWETNVEQLRQICARFDLGEVFSREEADEDAYLFLLMSHVVEKALIQDGSPIAVYDFPPSQAALAKINAGVAARFEVYCQGVELANGFYELTDPAVQRARFMQDLASRQHLSQACPPPDESLLQAMEHGLPECSGVALGVDRLLALALQQPNIAACMAFDSARA